MNQLITSRELQNRNRSFIKFELRREERLETKEKKLKSKIQKTKSNISWIKQGAEVIKHFGKLPPSSQRLGDTMK